MKMKNALLNCEISLASKKLHRATRKAARIIGNMIHSGLVGTASPDRDVWFMILAFFLECATLAVLWWKLQFGLGLAAGLVAIDSAGALLTHVGVGDRNWRAAQIGAAATAEEKAAIAVQRPGYFAPLRALGILCILGPLCFKVASLFTLPGALTVLAGLTPFLLVAFFSVAAIHLCATGYAVAHLRYRRAERRDQMAMLRSEKFAHDRDEHLHRIKGTREHRFTTFQHLTPVHHTDGHSLTLEAVDADGLRHFLLSTRGRFDDSDLDYMANGQKDAHAKTVLCQEGLRAQLVIEQSEPLTSTKVEAEEKLSAANIAPTLSTVDPVLARQSVPPAVSAVSGNGSQSPFPNAVRGVAMAVMGALALGLAGCEQQKPEPVKVSLVATKPLTRSAARLPENVLDLLAPPRPLAGKYVPLGEIVRLDLPGENTESLAPAETTNGAQKAMELAWQAGNPELELAKSADSLRARVAGLAAKASGDLDAETAAKRVVEFVATARKEGREVLAVSRSAKDGVVAIAKGVTVEARATAKEAAAFIEEKLKGGASANVAVLLDPPVYSEPVPKLASELGNTTAHPEANGSAAEPPKAAPADAPQVAQPGPRILPVSGSSTTVNVHLSESERGNAVPQITFELPAGSRQVGRSILFATNSWRLTEEGGREIEAIVAAVKNAGGLRVTIVAGADGTGTEERNGHLADRRGAVVKAALMARELVVDLVVVGDALSPANTPVAQRAEFRAVKVFSVQNPSTAQR